MYFNYKNHYKKLMNDLTDIFIENIERMPENDKDLPPDHENEKDTNIVQYSKKRTKQRPLKFD